VLEQGACLVATLHYYTPLYKPLGGSCVTRGCVFPLWTLSCFLSSISAATGATFVSTASSTIFSAFKLESQGAGFDAKSGSFLHLSFRRPSSWLSFTQLMRPMSSGLVDLITRMSFWIKSRNLWMYSVQCLWQWRRKMN